MMASERAPGGGQRLTMAKLRIYQAYGGDIDGQGPRYCPSIEDKVVRFADKEHHLLFVEPDGIDTSEVYLQGFSSSMPPELQDRRVEITGPTSVPSPPVMPMATTIDISVTLPIEGVMNPV